jgi:hypothetical protein
MTQSNLRRLAKIFKIWKPIINNQNATVYSVKSFIGRDIERGIEPHGIDEIFTAEEARHPLQVISFYTADNEYAQYAERLCGTLNHFGLNYVLYPIKRLRRWEVNCAYKADFIHEQWKASDCPIVWLDADATVEALPGLFQTLTADFAIHKHAWNDAEQDRGWEFLSGTLYFGKTPRAEALLQQWLLRCRADPLTWDQVHLSSAWCDISSTMPLKTSWLP